MVDYFKDIINKMKKINIHDHEYMTFGNIPRNIYQTLLETSKKFPDKKALSDDFESISYSEFISRVDNFSSILYNTYGICKGDVCAILSLNSIDFCVSFYSITKIGAIVLPLSTKLTSQELFYPLHNSEAKLLILDEKWIEKILQIQGKVNIENLIFTGIGHDFLLGPRIRNLDTKIIENFHQPSIEDAALLIYTSGTTGRPKGALITHFNILNAIEAYHQILNLSDEDSTVISVPIFHITGLVALLCLFIHIGGSIYLLPYFDAKETLEKIQDHQVTFFHGSPTVFILLLSQKGSFPTLPSWKKAACGSAHLPSSVIRALHDWLPSLKMHVVYGLTETSSPATIMPNDPEVINKMGSSGMPIPGLEIRIINPETNHSQPRNVPGELEVKGNVVIEKYLKMDSDHKNVFHDGWFRTGDIAKIDNDGFVYILDRKKDMINRGGEKIYSIEVEEVISDYPGVHECSVIGIPDPVYGEIPIGLIVNAEGIEINLEHLKKFVDDRLAKFKVPTEYIFVDELPKNASGKVDKKVLKMNYS